MGARQMVVVVGNCVISLPDCVWVGTTRPVYDWQALYGFYCKDRHHVLSPGDLIVIEELEHDSIESGLCHRYWRIVEDE